MTVASRVALVLSKNLSPGEGANVAAILMGQLSAQSAAIYAEACPHDRDGLPHAGIKHSTVVLTGRPGQLKSLARDLANEEDRRPFCCFSSLGQSLNNEFETYQRRLAEEDIAIVGVGLFGDHDDVRAATKQFSLLQ
jgi:hypothetical protein